MEGELQTCMVVKEAVDKGLATSPALRATSPEGEVKQPPHAATIRKKVLPSLSGEGRCRRQMGEVEITKAARGAACKGFVWEREVMAWWGGWGGMWLFIF